MSKSKHAESLVGKRILIISGENGGRVYDVLGIVFTMEVFAETYPFSNSTSYTQMLRDYVLETFGVEACYSKHAGLNLVVKSGQSGYLIAVPRKNHYRVL